MLDLSRRQRKSQLVFQKIKIINLIQKKNLAQADARSRSCSTKTRKSSNSLIKDISKKCNILVQQQQLNLTAYARYFITSVKINSYQLIAIIDSDATSNFIVKTFVKREEYST